jgi:hypothetical protein
MDPVPDPLLLRKSGSAGNRTRGLGVCSQELWPRDHRRGRSKVIRYIISSCVIILLKGVEVSWWWSWWSKSSSSSSSCSSCSSSSSGPKEAHHSYCHFSLHFRNRGAYIPLLLCANAPAYEAHVSPISDGAVQFRGSHNPPLVAVCNVFIQDTVISSCSQLTTSEIQFAASPVFTPTGQQQYRWFAYRNTRFKEYALPHLSSGIASQCNI